MKLLSLTFDNFREELRLSVPLGDHQAGILYKELMQRGNPRLDGFRHKDFKQSRIEKIKAVFTMTAASIGKTIREESVTKFSSIFFDGAEIESVIIPAKDRTTLCISSQVGCGRACAFCATGSMGLRRNLTTDEIVWQLFAARHILRSTVDNVVLMGMGEPFDNYDNVIQAVRVISDQRGFNIPERYITLSTAGHAEGIRRLAAEKMPRLRLAVSLHSAIDSVRSTIMPINRAWNLAVLKDALLAYPLGRDSVIFIEYTLINGINDSVSDAEALADYLDGLDVRVNLIPCNSGTNPGYAPPSSASVEAFKTALVKRKLFVRMRTSRGESIQAACGQLTAL